MTPPPMDKKKETIQKEKNKNKRKYWCRVANSRSFTAYSHGFTAAPRRIDFAKTNHATFLYTTTRLHPFSMQLPAVQEGRSMPEAVLPRQQHGSWESTRRAQRPQPDGGDAHRAMLPDHARLKGGQLGYGGHVVNVAQDITTFAATLSRLCLLYTSPSPRDGLLSRMPSSA